MPEGHKVHFIARQHTDWFGGQSLKVTSPQGRFRGDARRVSGRQLSRVQAVGKQLFYDFGDHRIVHIHLGRYGKFRCHDNPPPKPVGQVRLRMVGDVVSVDLNGPMICRVISPEQRDEVVAKLGPDPLAGGRKSTVLTNIRQSTKPIGTLLLDQSIVAGVGNIFRAEVLFEIGLNPQTRGCDLSPEMLDQLWRSLKRQMKTGLRHGRIITVTAQQAGKPLAKLQDGERFRIYGKRDCPNCDGSIEIIELASRKLYVCPRCQD